MSILNVWVSPDRVYVGVDTLASADGLSVTLVKALPLPAKNALLAGRGEQTPIEQYAAPAVEGFDDFSTPEAMARLAAEQVRWIRGHESTTQTGGPLIVAELARAGVRIETLQLGEGQ